MVILKSIKLNNFLSHKNTSLDFRPDQQLLIDGKSGSGKSAIVESLIWALYGIGRSDNRAMIKRGESAAKVVVHLTEGSKEYMVERKITGTGKHSLEINVKEEPGGEFSPVLESGIRQKQEFLEKEVLRCSYLLFINSVVYPQENTENFVHQNASKRKDLLMEIVNADSFDVYLSLVKECLHARKEEISGHTGAIETLKSNIAYDEEKVSGKGQIEKEVAKLEEEKVAKVAKNSHLQGIQNKNNLIDVKVAQIRQEIDNYKANKGRKELLFNRTNAEIAQIPDKKEELPADFDKNYVDTKASLKETEEQTTKLLSWNDQYNTLLAEKPQEIDYKSQIWQINRDMIDKIKEEIELCPEIKKICPILVEKRDKEVAKMSEKLQDLSQKETGLNSLLNSHAEKMSSIGDKPVVDAAKRQELTKYLDELDGIKAKVEQQNTRIQEKASLEAKIKELAQEMAEIDAQIAEYEEKAAKEEQEKQMADIIDSELLRASSELEMVERQLSAQKGELAIITSSEARLKESKAELEKYEYNKMLAEEKLEEMLLLREAFSNNGLKAIVTDYVVPKLEDRINDILHKVSDFTVRLNTQKIGLSNSTLEGLFINIFNERGEEFDYGNYSGGEKLKITVAISEALAELQKIGFRVLDELFVGLDEESTESFADVIAALQSRFSQLICISHLTNIKDAFAEKITLAKQNGTTKII